MILLTSYFLCMAIVFLVMVSMMIDGEFSDIESDKIIQTFLIVILAHIVAPITVMGFSGALLYWRWENRTTNKVNEIIGNLERTAALAGKISSYDLYDKNKTALKYELISEAAKTCLSREDLEFLLKVPKHVQEIDKDIKRIIMDELFERQLLSK